MKNIPIAMKFGTPNSSSLLIIKMIFEIADLDSLGRFGLKIAMCLIFIKFGNQNKSNMLIMNILLGIDYLHWKLEICKIWSQNRNVLQFLWNLALADYEYSTWNWLSWPMIIDWSKFGPNTEICSNFYKIWHSNMPMNIILASV